MSTSKLFVILTAGCAIYQMLIKRFKSVCFLGCFVLTVLARAGDTNNSEVCHLPKAAESALAAKLPGWRIVSKSELTEHDRALWNEKHSRLCPGIAVGDYFGDGKDAYAVTLIKLQPTNMLQTLVLLKSHDTSYELIELSKPQEASRVLVVFKLKPGVVEDIESGEKIKIARDAIAYEDIAAGELVYAWQGDKIREIQTSE